MLILTIVVVLLILVDIVFYILATGKFALIDTRANLIKGDMNVSFKSIRERLTAVESRVDTLEDLQKQMGENIAFLTGDVADVKEEVGDIKLDIAGLQNKAANETRPLEAVTPTAKNGRRSTTKREVK